MTSVATIHVAFGIDDRYAPYAGAVIASVMANADPGDHIIFHILTFGLSDDNLAKFKTLCANSSHEIYFEFASIKEFTDFPETVHTLNAFLRLVAPKLLAGMEKVIYLDADLIVLSSLRALWENDVAGVALAAAPDAQHFFRGSAENHWRNIGLLPGAVYFNSGVLVMNLDYWREHNLTDRLAVWLRSNGTKALYSDQDALNALLATEVRSLPLRWNFQTPLVCTVLYGWGTNAQLEDAARMPAIIHFTTSRKPWRREYKIPYAAAYRRHLASTPWGDTAAPKLTQQNIWIRLKEEGVHGWRRLHHGLRIYIGRAPSETKTLFF